MYSLFLIPYFLLFFFLCISEKDKMLGSAFLGVQRIVHSATEDQEFWSLVVHFLRQGMRARGYHLFPFLIAIFSFCSASLNTYFPSASQHLSSFYELSIPQHPTTNLQKAFFTLHSNVWNSSSSYRILAPNYRWKRQTHGQTHQKIWHIVELFANYSNFLSP